MAAGEIRVPDLGDFSDVLIIDVMVKAGDRVEVESPLITLETDKATMDIPSPVAGVIATMHVAKGDRVSTGAPLATLEGAAPETAATPDGATTAPSAGTPASEPAPGSVPENEATADGKQPADVTPAKSSEAKSAETSAAPSSAPSPPAAAAPAPATIATPPARVDEASFASAHASPSVRAFARELGVDLGKVRGSGRKGRVTSDDVKAYVKSILTSGAAAASALPRVPTVDFAKFGPVEVVPLTRIQRISGPRLHASWVNVPHVTQFEEADITELEDARRSLKLRAANEGIALTSLAFVLKACALALAQFPRVGASLDPAGQNLVMKKYCHLGFAADTPDGLVVPVIRDADRKDVFEIAKALGELSAKARAGKLSGAEMQGGCFTVSNLGGIGGTSFTPIINAPEVAVLGISRASHKPVYRDDEFVPRLMLPLSLSYDHRVVDGADGARFVAFLAEALGDVPRLMAKPS